MLARKEGQARTSDAFRDTILQYLDEYGYLAITSGQASLLLKQVANANLCEQAGDRDFCSALVLVLERTAHDPDLMLWFEGD